ncbi:MAG: glycoside hydrolase family 3 C-terminal domain-containing protein [Bacteroidales bacterium]|nr:glycoside hydrolase family 3 C-terminal domain-containing protein [Bacteroidales bacterium]
MKKILTILSSLALLVGCGPKQTFEYPFQDPRLSIDERIDNLMSLLTIEDKVGLMMNKNVSIDRLGIPSYNWWSEACHGVREDGYTVYPQPIGMAAAFNPQQMYDVFSQVSDEARANWNRSSRDIFGVPMGATYYPGNPELSFWCPNINIFRDPRWGRGQETCGEDPYLTGVLGLQTVLGMQGNDKNYYKTHACAKHYAVHSGPEPLRHTYDARVSQRDLWETYLPAFEKLVVEGNVREVMSAYNRYEGVPCSSNDRLLNDILRGKWGFDGIVVTDCDAINNYYTPGQHETQPDALSAAVEVALKGADLECGKVMIALIEGLQEGLVKEEDLDVHLRRILRGRFELGMFDPADRLPWAKLGEEVISSEEHDALATQAARESMVLLKNSGILPLSKDVKRLLVVGPNADDVDLLNGNYGGTPTEEHKHSLLEGIRNAVPEAEVLYAKACELNDDYNTIYHLPDFNEGQGVFVEFYDNNELKGQPKVSGYYKELNFSTFGAYGFAEGIPTDKISVRIKGRFVPDFSGPMSYTVSSDNGYVLKVNGRVVEKAQAAAGGRGFGFGRRGATYKTFDVQAGKPLDIEIEYRRGAGPFAMLRADFCERKYADFTAEKQLAQDVDAIIVIGGISAQMEGEGGDKADIELPHVQQRLLRAMRETGKAVVFVNCSGSAIGFASVEEEYDALLQAWYPGQGGAKALADVLFGDFNPSGKLPVTFYASTADLPDFLDYSMENRTYRYFHGEPLYAFGYGLSYTTFRYGEGKLSKPSMKQGGKVTVSFPITNTGSVEGSEIVQVYVQAIGNPDAPIKSLQGFDKVQLAPGASKKVSITLTDEAFKFYDEKVDGLSVRPGNYRILFGSSSRQQDLQALDFQVL